MNTEERAAWLASLKPGDEVDITAQYGAYRELATVDRRTNKTITVKVRGFGEVLINIARGGCGVGRIIFPVTAATKERVYRKLITGLLLRGIESGAFTTSQLERMAEIAKENKVGD